MNRLRPRCKKQRKHLAQRDITASAARNKLRTTTVKTAFLHKSALRILHLEDSVQDSELVAEMLREAGLLCEITCARTRQAFEMSLAGQSFDLILCDYGLPGYDGFSA